MLRMWCNSCLLGRASDGYKKISHALTFCWIIRKEVGIYIPRLLSYDSGIIKSGFRAGQSSQKNTNLIIATLISKKQQKNTFSSLCTCVCVYSQKITSLKIFLRSSLLSILECLLEKNVELIFLLRRGKSLWYYSIEKMSSKNKTHWILKKKISKKSL